MDDDELKIYNQPSGLLPSAEFTIATIQDQNQNQVIMHRKEKLITSALIWFCTFTMGLSVSFLNASLLELSEKFDKPVSTTSNVFTVLTFSFLAGAFSCGMLFNYVNRQLTSVLLLTVMGASVLLIPVVPNLTLLFITTGVLGFTAAGYNCAQIVWVIELWESAAAPYIQVQHFCYALGSFISPLLLKPFLTVTEEEDDDDEDSKHQSKADNLSLIFEYSTTPGFSEYQYDNPNLYIPYLIGASTILIGASLIFISYWTRKYQKPRTQLQDKDIKKTNESQWNKRNIILILLSGSVLGTYTGMENCTMQFLPTFTHFIELRLSKPDGALVLSSLAGAFTAGRALGIFIVFKVPPQFLLACNMVIIIAGNTCLILLANNSMAWLWTGSILLGIGFCTVVPSFYGYIEKHLKITNTIGALFILSDGVLSGSYPFIIGRFIEDNPFVLMYTNYFSLTVCSVAFTTIYILTSRMGFGIAQGASGDAEMKGDVKGQTHFKLPTVNGTERERTTKE